MDEKLIYSKKQILFVFFFKQKTAYEISACLVGSEMCIRDRCCSQPCRGCSRKPNDGWREPCKAPLNPSTCRPTSTSSSSSSTAARHASRGCSSTACSNKPSTRRQPPTSTSPSAGHDPARPHRLSRPDRAGYRKPLLSRTPADHGGPSGPDPPSLHGEVIHLNVRVGRAAPTRGRVN